jgi:Putative GTPase activating protein for Arf
MLSAPGASRNRPTGRPNRRKPNETPEDQLRALQRANKQCADCTTRLPQCVNLTIGTFICMVCAGIHRELNMRVKGVGASTFTQEEVDKLRETSNEQINTIYLARYASSYEKLQAPTNNYDQKVLRVWIKRKYQEKAWYELPATRVSIPTKTEVAQAPSLDSKVDLFAVENDKKSEPDKWDAFKVSSHSDDAIEFPSDFGSTQTKQSFADFEKQPTTTPHQNFASFEAQSQQPPSNHGQSFVAFEMNPQPPPLPQLPQIQPQQFMAFHHSPQIQNHETPAHPPQTEQNFGVNWNEAQQSSYQPSQTQTLANYGNLSSMIQQQDSSVLNQQSFLESKSPSIQNHFNAFSSDVQFIQSYKQQSEHHQGLIATSSIQESNLTTNLFDTEKIQAASSAQKGLDGSQFPQGQVNQAMQWNGIANQDSHQVRPVDAQLNSTFVQGSYQVVESPSVTLDKNGDRISDAFANLSIAPFNQVPPSQSVSVNKGVSRFTAGSTAIYVSNGSKSLVKVLNAHLDDKLDPFYTIQLSDGREKQTDADHLLVFTETDESQRISELLLDLNTSQQIMVVEFIQRLIASNGISSAATTFSNHMESSFSETVLPPAPNIAPPEPPFSPSSLQLGGPGLAATTFGMAAMGSMGPLSTNTTQYFHQSATSQDALPNPPLEQHHSMLQANLEAQTFAHTRQSMPYQDTMGQAVAEAPASPKGNPFDVY